MSGTPDGWLKKQEKGEADNRKFLHEKRTLESSGEVWQSPIPQGPKQPHPRFGEYEEGRVALDLVGGVKGEGAASWRSRQRQALLSQCWAARQGQPLGLALFIS